MRKHGREGQTTKNTRTETTRGDNVDEEISRIELKQQCFVIVGVLRRDALQWFKFKFFIVRCTITVKKSLAIKF